VAGTKAILIIGGSGFVGTHLALKLREGYKVFATYHTKRFAIPGVTFVPMEVANRNWAKRVIYAMRPDVVIYAAGGNDFERAEKSPREAQIAHINGAAIIASSAEILQPKFIYLSSCYAFDGMKGNYREGDTVLPSSELGKAKVGGENGIRGRSLNYVIIRSSPLIGRGNGRNPTFLDSLRIRLSRKEKLSLPAHELHSFAPVQGLTDAIVAVIDHGVRNKTIHYGGLTKLSYFDYARLFAKRFNLDPGLITPHAPKGATALHEEQSSTYDYSLNSSLAIELLKIKPFLLEESFDLIDQLLVPRL
jgi:dTDP-4-dehydrorhamnose reductase